MRIKRFFIAIMAALFVFFAGATLLTACNPIEEEKENEGATAGVVYEIRGTEACVVGYKGTETEVRIAERYTFFLVTSIDTDAFRDCDKLTSVVIPNSVTDIKECAFYNCGNLTSVEIGDGVTSIGEHAFNNCSNLTSVEIGDGVTSIGWGVFYNCYNLTSVTFKDTSTWYTTTSSLDWENKTGGAETSVSTPSTNATYFKSTYYNFYWYKL